MVWSPTAHGRAWRTLVLRRLLPFAGAAVLLASGATPALASGPGYDWLQFGGDPAHTGSNTAETILSATTVHSLGLKFTAGLPGVADAPAVLRRGVATAGGTRDLVFLHTREGATVALDASTGAVVWTRTVGPGSCGINNTSTPCYTTAGSAVDPSGRFVYSYGLDGRAHKYAAGTGSETTTGGWPELVTTKGFDEKGSSDLSIATSHGVSYLYVTIAGYPGDHGDYQGHVTTINLGTGSQKVFNTVCSDKTEHFASRKQPDCSQVQSAVWARGGVLYDSATDRIVLVSGNGTFLPSSHDWGDSVMAIHPDGSGTAGNPVDSYTPTNYRDLQNEDADLGSTAPAKVKAPAGSPQTDLGVQSGKDADLRLLDLANLSGQGGPGHLGGSLQVIRVPQGGGVFSQPSAWTDPANGTSWFFVANSHGLSGLKVTLVGGKPSMTRAWTVSTGGTTPVIANNVLYYLTDGGARALNPVTGATLWSDSSGPVGLHWQSVMVADGVLYYPDGHSHLRAFTVPRTGPVTGIAAKCLDVRRSGTANGTPVDLWACNGTGAQRWTVGLDGTIRGLGKCLDVHHAGTANGTVVQLYACNGTAAQRWGAGPDGSLRALNRCLDDRHAGTANGTVVQLYACNGTPAQRWQLP